MPREPADDAAPDAGGSAGGGEPVAPAAGAGLDLARWALSAAKAEAARRGHRPGAATGSGADAAPASPDGAGAERRRRSGRVEDQRSGARPDARDPQLLGTAVRRLLADRGWEAEMSIGGVLGRWAEVMGPELAAHCTPEGFTDGELSIRADSTAWATQLRLIAPQVVRRLNEEVGAGTVSRVRVLGPSAPSWRRGPLGVKGRGPRDTYG